MILANSKYIPPTDEQIAVGLAPFGALATPVLCDQIRTYLRILLQWNEKISLTAIKEPQEMLTRHFGESMFAASTVPIERGRLADVGSGAGFPGIPLKLVCTELNLTLIELNGKKAAFLAEVVRELRLADVTVLRSRFANASVLPSSIDFITSRALDPAGGLLLWAHRSLALGGRLVLWTSVEAAKEIYADVHWSWCPAIPIPQSKQRILLVGQPR